jgi:hypothetical protein
MREDPMFFRVIAVMITFLLRFPDIPFVNSELNHRIEE